jgi:hypothetical protein
MESSRRSRASAAIGFDNSISSICVHISLSSALFSKLGDLTPLYFFFFGHVKLVRMYTMAPSIVQ